jgi:hypothetical protein
MNIKTLQDHLIRIGNIKTWLVTVPLLHPDSEAYDRLWSKYTKFCIEGLWGEDLGGWRYMPGTLFYYGNFHTIYDFDELEKVRKPIKPLIRDIDWMIHYAYLEAQGFSGWKDDDEYTSDYIILDDKKLAKLKSNHRIESKIRYADLFNSKGEAKKFLHPRDNIRKLHNSNKGLPLYHNNASNVILFGSRGGGKSYTISGISSHHLTFDALKYFKEEDFNNPPTIEICIGASDSNKSADLCNKIKDGLFAFGSDKTLGVWGSVYDEDYTPCPFYRDWSGTLDSGNKANPFRYEYKAKIGGRWYPGQGSKSKLVHVNYSDKKQGGEAAAAGGRYVLIVYEEIGLQSNFKDAVNSNVGTVVGRGGQQGVQIAIGTSGNIDLVQQSKAVFTNPKENNFLEYDDIWEDSGKIGFFLPCYLTDSSFKDENGNTDIEASIEYYMQRREVAARASDESILRYEKMNYPLIPSDMWVSSKGNYFPTAELLEQEKFLVKQEKYKIMGVPSKLTWDSNSQNGVKVEFDSEAEPFYEYPYTRKMTKLDGAVMIYQPPEYINGEIPNDMYLFVLDPYVADNIDEGGSLGAFYGFINPKYAKNNGSTMVCSYIGKHPNGKDGYYENIEKIIAYYGNCHRSLWYEANRGDSVRGYFIRKNKTTLLAFSPTFEKGSSTHESKTVSYGITVGSLEFKLQLISDTGDLLRSEVMYNGKEVRYYETIPDLFLIKQMISFDFKKHKNFDAVSAFILAPFMFKELYHSTLKELEKKNKHNPLAVFSMNPNVFKNNELNNYAKFKK